ncbi:MAG TPA: hypothetical protein VI072_24245 [Polyangiaceae bacterium]
MSKLGVAVVQARISSILLAAVLGACSSEPGTEASADEFQSLVEVDWSLEPGKEMYLCKWLTVDRDLYLDAFAPIHPVGTHHTQLSVIEAPVKPDGIAPCGATTVGRIFISGGGVGTEPGYLPDGVAMFVPAGSQLLLNLHLFNTGDRMLTGRSGTRGRFVDAAQVEHIAEAIAAGPLKLAIPPGRSTQQGTCTFDHDSTIYRVLPHMHQTGVHMKVVANSSERGPVLLHDAPYDFNNQLAYDVELLPMKKGDQLQIECTYENPSGRTLPWGESSNDEMCLAGLARFPRGTGIPACPL